MPVTSNDIANQAITQMGDNQPLVVGNAPNFDSSAAGKALKQIYAPTVAAVARSFEWDFARRTEPLVASGNVAPVPWSREYLYPTNGVQVWQLMPSVVVDPNDPIPVNFVEANAVVGATVTKVIHTDLSPALAVFNVNPNENVWDALFRQSVVELLARALSLALAGKPDLADSLLQSYGTFSQVAAGRQN